MSDKLYEAQLDFIFEARNTILDGFEKKYNGSTVKAITELNRGEEGVDKYHNFGFAVPGTLEVRMQSMATPGLGENNILHFGRYVRNKRNNGIVYDIAEDIKNEFNENFPGEIISRYDFLGGGFDVPEDGLGVGLIYSEPEAARDFLLRIDNMIDKAIENPRVDREIYFTV